MGFTTVPDKATGDVFTEAMWDTFIKDNFNTGVPVLLGSVLLGATTASLNLSSIPQTHGSLMLVWCARGDVAAVNTFCAVRFNGDSGANYDRQFQSVSNNAGGAGENFAQTSVNVGNIPGASATANLFNGGWMSIPNYTSAIANKIFTCVLMEKTANAAGGVDVVESLGAWRSNAAITQITLLPGSGNFIAGSRFSVYGTP